MISLQVAFLNCKYINLNFFYFREKRKGKLPRSYTKNTEKKSFNCMHCTKSFTWPTGLKNHIRTHTGVKPYVLFHKLFAHPDDLKRHSKFHSSTELTGKDKAFHKVESEFYIEKKEEDHIILVDPEDYSDVSLCKYSMYMCIIDLFSLKDK
jgi:hypothetical protein